MSYITLTGARAESSEVSLADESRTLRTAESCIIVLHFPRLWDGALLTQVEVWDISRDSLYFERKAFSLIDAFSLWIVLFSVLPLGGVHTPALLEILTALFWVFFVSVVISI